MGGGGAELKLEALLGWYQLELFFSLSVPSQNCQKYIWYQEEKFLFLLAVLTLETFAEGYETPPGPWKSDAASPGSLLPGTVLSSSLNHLTLPCAGTPMCVAFRIQGQKTW